MPAIDIAVDASVVVVDASVALTWFHAEGEREVGPARALLEAHKSRSLALLALDLTGYELGNALLRGHPRLSAERVAMVLESLWAICPVIHPRLDEMRLATQLATRHKLTLYDAAYAAVAQRRGATLVTLDQALLDTGLGVLPSTLTQRLDPPSLGT